MVNRNQATLGIRAYHCIDFQCPAGCRKLVHHVKETKFDSKITQPYTQKGIQLAFGNLHFIEPISLRTAVYATEKRE